MYSLTKLPDQEKNETGILLLRRHWFTFFITFLAYIFLLILPVLVLWVMQDEFFTIYVTGDASYGVFVLVMTTYYLALITFLFHEFIDYYLDVWVITTERIIAIEQKGLFARTIAEQKLFRVQDVTSEVKGLFPTFLNFGDVFVQTAAEQQRFIFKNVPKPDMVVRLIHDQTELCKLHGHGVE